MQRKDKLGSRFFTIILVILILLSLFGVIIYLSGIFYFSGLFPCVPPPWVEVDGVATAQVHAFYDDNQNGALDEGERSLPFIAMSMGEKTAQTDQNGETKLLLFKTGCVCNCSKGEILNVQVPDGWQTTTPVEILLNGSEEVIQLGFFR
ncbi:MAG: hypothetical protein CVU39_13015 [Chloroflexi bacterium HGW-Chloroflexi-10]|nr:MAG: hypothetical protein CVU39_13015 [Chloroflexi bacterium HGW-Chloroflexi-10]